MAGKVFMFPGQGSQVVGMGKDFYDNFEYAKKRFEYADEILGKKISEIIFNGPEEELKQTNNTQPALFLVESLISDLLKENSVEPVYSMGHSLGEYPALYCSGVISFEDGLKLVAKRGELMAVAGNKNPGTMAAIIGIEKDKIKEILETIDGIVVSANENSLDQTVISGEIKAVETACEKLKEAGAKRAIILPVSGAFHSPLMKDAADEFKEFTNSISFNDAEIPIVSNVTAQPETSGEKLKELTYEQLLSPVRWVDSLKWIVDNNYTDCIEVGPGNVLKGLARKSFRELTVLSCGNVDSFNSLIS